MNQEILEKAKILNKEMKELEIVLSDIKYHYAKTRKGISKSFDWLLKFTNKSEKDKPPEANIIVFNNIDCTGSTIPVDEGLILLIKEYFENKLKEKEQQFNELN